MTLVQTLGHTACPGGNMLLHSIVKTQKEGGVGKGGLWVKCSHMGISFNCAPSMSTSAPRGMLFLAGSCSLHELKVGPVTS